MNSIDINWRNINQDFSIFEEKNRNRAVLIQTDVNNSPVFCRISYAKYVDIVTNRDYSCQETVTFYAFLS